MRKIIFIKKLTFLHKHYPVIFQISLDILVQIKLILKKKNPIVVASGWCPTGKMLGESRDIWVFREEGVQPSFENKWRVS